MVYEIAAANYSHIQYFPDSSAYDQFYEIMLRVVDIAHLEFATNVQDLVISYLCGVSEGTAVWFEKIDLAHVANTVFVLVPTGEPTKTWESRTLG